MTNAIKAAHDALENAVRMALSDLLSMPGAGFHRNASARVDWSVANAPLIAMDDDKSPEVTAVMCGPIYDLTARPVIVVARPVASADRETDEWADVEAIKARLALDVTLGGVVEDARLDEADNADLADDTWMGGGIEITVRLMFNAPSKAG